MVDLGPVPPKLWSRTAVGVRGGFSGAQAGFDHSRLADEEGGPSGSSQSPEVRLSLASVTQANPPLLAERAGPRLPQTFILS